LITSRAYYFKVSPGMIKELIPQIITKDGALPILYNVDLEKLLLYYFRKKNQKKEVESCIRTFSEQLG
jgi:hypothetical protein